MYFNFTNPSYLVLLFLVPVLIFFHFYSIKNQRKRSIVFANFEAIAKIKGIDLYSKNIIILFLNIAMAVAIIFSLAGLTLYKEMDASSFSYVIAVDSSESMGAIDISPNRLFSAKEASIEFVNSLPYNLKVGVLSFSGTSYIEQELTDNKEKIIKAIDGIELKKFGGTDIYEAVSISSFMLKEEENKAVIILSDGQMNVGNVYDAIEYARNNNLLVHSFGIGTVEGGEASYGISKLDEDSLKSLSYNTNGNYFKITSKEEMKKAFSEIVPLTRKIGSVNLSLYLIIAVLVFFILEQFLIEFIHIKF